MFIINIVISDIKLFEGLDTEWNLILCHIQVYFSYVKMLSIMLSGRNLYLSREEFFCVSTLLKGSVLKICIFIISLLGFFNLFSYTDLLSNDFASFNIFIFNADGICVHWKFCLKFVCWILYWKQNFCFNRSQQLQKNVCCIWDFFNMNLKKINCFLLTVVKKADGKNSDIDCYTLYNVYYRTLWWLIKF